MKCPHSDKTIVPPQGESHHVHPAGWIIILTCPHCQAILGAVNKPED